MRAHYFKEFGMKKTSFKILLALLVAVLLLSSVLTINVFAGDTHAYVTLSHCGENKRMSYEIGKAIALPSPESKVGGKVYGWFDKDGNFYEPGASFVPTRDITLYCADGGEISLSGSLAVSAYKGFSYIKLKSNVSLDAPIVLPSNQVLYLDLNGNNMYIETGVLINEYGQEAPNAAFITDECGKDCNYCGECGDCGVILANSSNTVAQINHIANGSTDFNLNSLVSVSPSKQASNLTFVVGENIKITENMNLFSVQTDVSQFRGALNVAIHGEVECDRLLRTNGISCATVKIHNTAKLTAHGEFLFEDISNNEELLTFIVEENSGSSSAKLYLDGHGLIKDVSRITPYIYGGSYSKDISSFFPVGNYSFKENGSLFDFKACAHAGPLAEHAYGLCDTPCTLNHHCNYCDLDFPVDYPNGVGHNKKLELIQEPVNTPTETKEAIYRTSCSRCDYEKLDRAYPDPASVYITVKFVENEKVKELRVPATDVFSFDKNNKTKLISFSVDNISYVDHLDNVIKVPVESIFYVQVPLGTTDIYGEYRTSANDEYDAEVGVFTNDYYLKEVELPASIVNIDSYAFYNMASIEKVWGLEYITGSIGTKAFMQTTNKNFLIDHVVINASSVGEYAFKNLRMKTLTIGKSVSKISNYAFSLDAGLQSILAEIFVEGNDSKNGVTIDKAKGSMGNYHQFSGLALVYVDHNYVKESKPATCIEYGHDYYECSRCHHSYKDNFVEEFAPHNLVVHVVPSTCQSYGFDGHRCTVCDIKIKKPVGGDLPLNKNNHTWQAGVVKIPLDPNGYFCVDPYYTLRKCGCGAIEEDIEENRGEIVEPPIDATHNYKETVIIVATCGEYGRNRFSCKDCKYTYEKIIEPTRKHNMDIANKEILVEATCSTPESGNVLCLDCGLIVPYTLDGIFNTETHVKVPGDLGTIISEPSTEYAGLRGFTCADCKELFTEEIPRIDDGIIIKIPFTDKEWFRTDEDTLRTALIVLFVSIPLLAGIILTFVFTFTKKKNKSAGYKFRFNTMKKGEKSSKSVAEQLAEMNLSDELPPDIPITEGGERDDQAAWTAYVDAINSDYERTVELNAQNPSEDTSSDLTPPSEDAWKAYVEALNKDYEETLELEAINAGGEEQSFADAMQDTVVTSLFDDEDVSNGEATDSEAANEEDTGDEESLDDDEKLDL